MFIINCSAVTGMVVDPAHLEKEKDEDLLLLVPKSADDDDSEEEVDDELEEIKALMGSSGTLPNAESFQKGMMQLVRQNTLSAKNKKSPLDGRSSERDLKSAEDRDETNETDGEEQPPAVAGKKLGLSKWQGKAKEVQNVRFR
jgi:hypothetical protein